jgi:uncharacterized alkaline shock family protein YloU
MIFFKKLGVLIYAILMLCAGLVLVLISANVISADQWNTVLNTAKENLYSQAALAAIGGIFVIIGITAPLRVGRKLNKNRLIAFQNPEGEVTISLSAIEDYVRKVAGTVSDIKDIRSRVSTGRRGINIVCDAAIYSGANIPEVTEKMQQVLKNKLSGMLGVEAKINVKMNISKIAKGASEPEGGIVGEDTGLPNAPFRIG